MSAPTNQKHDRIVQLGHGGEGKLQDELIEFIIHGIKKKQLNRGIGLAELDDGATFSWEYPDHDGILTADGHTINPINFPGGDLGSLSVCGTVNDIIMMGGIPKALTSTFLIEEGMSFDTLEKIVTSFNVTADHAGVAILAGDTKVMPKGTLNQMVITTTGFGVKPSNRKIHDSNCQEGAKIILTGTIGDHGAALIAQREGINLTTTLQSDVTLLTPLLGLLPNYNSIYAMKDPTRGGISAALNEWARKSNLGIWIQEDKIPIKKEVQAIADILGLDPYDIANEGKALICVAAEDADALLADLHTLSIGKNAQIIGEVRNKHPKRVILETMLGGTRFVEKPLGEVIPRIC